LGFQPLHLLCDPGLRRGARYRRESALI